MGIYESELYMNYIKYKIAYDMNGLEIHTYASRSYPLKGEGWAGLLVPVGLFHQEGHVKGVFQLAAEDHDPL